MEVISRISQGKIMQKLFKLQKFRFTSIHGDKMVKDIDLEKSPKDEELGNKTGSILDPVNAFKYCTDIVKKHDYYTYIVGQHFPKSKQGYYYTVQALFLEVLKAREISRQAFICQKRLLFWAETLHDVEAKKKIQEPIGVCINELYKNTNVNIDLMHKLISFQLFDLERSEMKTMNELTIYAENTRSLTFYLGLHILGIDDKNAYSAASHLGRCYGIIDVLRKMQYYLIQHRYYLPTEILLKHNLFFDRIYNPRREGLVEDEFYDVILEIAAHAKKHLEVSRSFKDKLPQHAHRALLLGIEAEQYLADLESFNFNVFDDHFRKISYVKTPYKILKAAKGNYY